MHKIYYEVLTYLSLINDQLNHIYYMNEEVVWMLGFDCLDVGYWLCGCWILVVWMLDLVVSTLDFGCVDAGFWLGGHWILVISTLDFGCLDDGF